VLPRRKILAICALAIVVIGTGGCAKGRPTSRIWTPAQAEQLLMDALQSDSPDERRRAIARVADSKYGDSDVSVRTMSLVVRTDTSQAVRRMAARGLGQSRKAAAFEPLLQVLDAPNHAQEVRDPDAALRRACIEAVDQLVQAGVPHDGEEELIPLAAQAMLTDADRGVRIAAARLLRQFQHPDALDALIEVLRVPEFALAYEAEQSLIALTGQTHNRRHADWRAWREEVDDPFAHAGRTPPALADETRQRRWWQLSGK
jgi:HEAT repeat protein